MDAHEHSRGAGTGTDRVIELPDLAPTPYGLPSLEWFHRVETRPYAPETWEQGIGLLANSPRLVNLFNADHGDPHRWMAAGLEPNTDGYFVMGWRGDPLPN